MDREEVSHALASRESRSDACATARELSPSLPRKLFRQSAEFGSARSAESVATTGLNQESLNDEPRTQAGGYQCLGDFRAPNSLAASRGSYMTEGLGFQQEKPKDRTSAVALSQHEIAELLRQIFKWKEGEIREVRVLGFGSPRHAVVASPEQAAEAIKGVAYGDGVYITMNPITEDAEVVKRVGNTLVRAMRGCATTDADMARRTLFVIDVDPVRPASTAATPAQLADANALAVTIVDELTRAGWPFPTVVSSGNGVHMYLSVNLDGASDLPSRALKALDTRFSTDRVKVDTTVGNASRIMRMPGTWNAKGDDRSNHRVATLVTVGEDRLVSAEQLGDIAPHRTNKSKAPASIATAFDLERWVTTNVVSHKGKEPWPGGGASAFRWVLAICPFNPAHNRGEAVITQQPSGAVGFRCHHDSCSENGWNEFRRVIEAAAQAKSSAAVRSLRAPYPVDALPPIIREVVTLQSDLADADPASVAVPLLTSMIGVVGNSVVVEPWPTWSESMAAWAVLVALSGSMKSATIGVVDAALADLERSFPPPEPKLTRQRLVSTDATVEALADLARANPRGLILLRDELAGFLRGIGQYKVASAADEAFWLSAIDGKRHIVHRRSTGETAVDRLLVSVIGGIQPPVFSEIMRHRKCCESGFAARFWIVWPQRRLFRLKPPPVDTIARVGASNARLQSRLNALRKIPMVDGKPMCLRFGKDAAEILMAFANRQEEVAHLLPDSSVERSSRSKARGWAARVAGLLALLRCYECFGVVQDGDPFIPDYSAVVVEPQDIEAAIQLVEWQLAENARALRVLRLDDLDLELERHDELAREALDAATGVVTQREFQRKHGMTAEQSVAILDGLVAARLWGKRFPSSGPAGGRPTVEYFPLGDSSLI